MNRRTRKRKQSGGKLVGQGAYGCGFFPGFRCASDKKRSKQFSKFMEHNDAMQEYQEVQHIRKVDPQLKYSVYPNKICNLHPDDFDIANEEGLFDCPMIDQDLDIEQKKEMYELMSKKGLTKLLQAPYGGEELQKIKDIIVYSKTDMKMDIIKILKELVNVFDALVLYQSKNLVHLDIKSDNIVCKDECKYIDFGISSTINNILKPNSEIYKKLYDWSKRGYLLRYRPFDMLFIFDDIWSNINNISNTNSSQFLKKEVDSYFKNMCARAEVPLEVLNAKYVREDDQTTIKYTGSVMYNIILKFIEMNRSGISGSKSKSRSTHSLSKSLKKFILFQADVYSLGLMMVAQIRDIFQVKMYHGNLYGTNEMIIGQKKPITNTIIDYKIVIELFELCKKMMHLDPFIRLTAHEAAAEYRSIIAKLD